MKIRQTARQSLALQLPAFIGVRTALNTLVRMVYPFLPVFGRGLGIDLGALSLAVTIRSASGILGPFLASVGDTRGRKSGMLLGVSLFTAGAGAMIVYPGYLGFVLSLVLGIMGNFVFVPSMQAFLGDRVGYQRRGLVIGLSEIGWSLAYILGVPVVGLIIERKGWQAPFPWLVGLGVFSLALLWILLPEDEPRQAKGLGLMDKLGLVAGSTPALAGILLALTMSASNELVSLTFGTWLEQAFAVKIAALSAAAVIIGVSELSGEVLVSGLVDRIGKHKAVAIGLVLNGLAVMALPFLGQTLIGALAGLFLIYLTFEFSIVSAISMMTEVLPAARATFMSTFVAATAIGRAMGDVATPFLYDTHTTASGGVAILQVALAAVLLNAAALIVLRSVKIAPGPDVEPATV